jgi:hypothetical protein
LPKNLRRMTASQKQMCGCEICIDGRAFHCALMEFRGKRLRDYDQIAAVLTFEGDIAAAVAVQLVRSEYFKKHFTGSETAVKPTHKIEHMRDHVAGMTCQPCGIIDTASHGLCHMNCTLGRCGKCPNAKEQIDDTELTGYFSDDSDDGYDSDDGEVPDTCDRPE